MLVVAILDGEPIIVAILRTWVLFARNKEPEKVSTADIIGEDVDDDLRVCKLKCNSVQVQPNIFKYTPYHLRKLKIVSWGK